MSIKVILSKYLISKYNKKQRPLIILTRNSVSTDKKVHSCAGEIAHSLTRFTIKVKEVHT